MTNLKVIHIYEITNLESLQRPTGGSQFGWHLGYRSSETTPMFELGEILVKVIHI